MMRCKIRSGTKRAQAKEKSSSMEEAIIRRGRGLGQGRSSWTTDVPEDSALNDRPYQTRAWRRQG